MCGSRITALKPLIWLEKRASIGGLEGTMKPTLCIHVTYDRRGSFPSRFRSLTLEGDDSEVQRFH